MSTEETEAKLTALWKRFETASQRRPLKKNCAMKRDELQAIWNELKTLRIYVGDGHYKEIEDLRLRILPEVAQLDSVMFNKLINELRDDVISLTAEVRWRLTWTTTLPVRLFDRIDRRARRVTE